ncbi:MAG TPA: hypothetical protein VGP77_07940 [Vicinamibacterales bacterium]|jgi:hypothetical protein|nr:hypothetical protein [Vicinamibacterales bacterium]
MRLLALLFTVTLVAAPAVAQQTPAPSTADTPSPGQDESKLPVSLSKIRGALEATPLHPLRTLDETPTFRIQIREKQKLEELLATLKFKPAPVPAGGIKMAEQNRIMFPWVDNPERQQFGAFNQSELLTILIENLLGKYLGGKAANAISKSERANAEAAAKEEVRSAIAQYCSAQPGNGAGLQICDSPVR